MYKQIIIVRKDLNMSKGKFAAQVSHASMAFLMAGLQIQSPAYADDNGLLHFDIALDEGCYREWIQNACTKVVLEAKNKNQLLNAEKAAEEMGVQQGKDFWLINDACRTELMPEETDENGVGRCLTCIGFKPMDAEIIDQIGKKYQLYS